MEYSFQFPFGRTVLPCLRPGVNVLSDKPNLWKAQRPSVQFYTVSGAHQALEGALADWHFQKVRTLAQVYDYIIARQIREKFRFYVRKSYPR